MKRSILAAVVVLGAFASAALADEAMPSTLGLGFRGAKVPTANASELSTGAPIGGRWWSNGQKWGIDVGFGFSTDKQGDKSLKNWSVEGGIPICAMHWDRVHVLVRPGVNYTSQDGLDAGAVIKDKFLSVTGELETEVFLVDRVSISASHGVGIVNYKPGEATGKTTTDFTTFGNNATSLGFHVYLWSGK
jgi:hypothetical protein